MARQVRLIEIVASSSEVRGTYDRICRLPSVLVEMPAGSIVLRDARTLHRWGANRTEFARTMLNLEYERDFGQSGRGVRLRRHVV